MLNTYEVRAILVYRDTNNNHQERNTMLCDRKEALRLANNLAKCQDVLNVDVVDMSTGEVILTTYDSPVNLDAIIEDYFKTMSKILK